MWYEALHLYFLKYYYATLIRLLVRREQDSFKLSGYNPVMVQRVKDGCLYLRSQESALYCLDKCRNVKGNE